MGLFGSRRYKDPNPELAAWTATSGEAIVTVHTKPALNGTFLYTVELKDIELERRIVRAGDQPAPSTIDSLIITNRRY